MKSKRIISVILSIAIMCSTAGCSKKKDENINSETGVTQNIDNKTKNNLQIRMIKFIENLEKANLGINLDNFYANAKTLEIIIYDLGKSKVASYNIDENKIILGDPTAEGFEHELMHVVLADRVAGLTGIIDKNNIGVGLEEGLVETISSEIKNSKYTAYVFSCGITKVLSIILSKDVLVEAINKHDIGIIVAAMANVKPEQSDAYEYLKRWDWAHNLINTMHTDFFENNSINNFEKTKDYENLLIVKSDLISRLKIYSKNYFQSVIYNENIDPEQELINMIAVLDIIDRELFLPEVDEKRKNDFFLKEEIEYIMRKYDITKDQYDNCSKLSRELLFFDNKTPIINKNKTK